MNLYRWSEIEREELNPLLARQVIHGDSITVARLYLKQGAVVPRHSHRNEQITVLQSGRLRFEFDDREVMVRAGESLQIPSDAAHRVIAEEDSEAIDLFAPVREDWKRGDDLYLRVTGSTK
jgi:quercetin dioxygenase-like cupin family protein